MTPLNSTTPAGAAVALSNGTPANIASLVLSTGTWLVWGNVDASLAGATLTALAASLSLTSAALSGQSGQSVPGSARLYPEPLAQLVANLVTATGTQTVDCGPTLVTVPPGHTYKDAFGNDLPAPTPTLYLVAQANFSAGSVSAYGSLFAVPLPS